MMLIERGEGQGDLRDFVEWWSGGVHGVAEAKKSGTQWNVIASSDDFMKGRKGLNDLFPGGEWTSSRA
jgi:hypothetical protein